MLALRRLTLGTLTLGMPIHMITATSTHMRTVTSMITPTNTTTNSTSTVLTNTATKIPTRPRIVTCRAR